MTGDLRTRDNKLSYWTLASPTPGELEGVVLALASAADRIDKIDLAWVDRAAVIRAGITIEVTPGATPVEALRSRHVDLTRLDLQRLGQVAGLVSSAVARDQWHRWSKREVLAILVEAARRNDLDPVKLPPAVQEEVLATLAAARSGQGPS